MLFRVDGDGAVDTVERRELVDAGRYDDLEAARETIVGDTPTRGVGDDLDLGNLVAFILSEHASFVNGVAVPVDGGAVLEAAGPTRHLIPRVRIGWGG